MPAPLNPLKQALADGVLQTGCWLSTAEAYVAEIMTTAGFDWLLVDGEHSPNDLRSIMAQLQVIDPSPSHAVVRVPVGDTAMIKQVLDAGAQSILVPMVDSVKLAQGMVQAIHYPPRGVRGVGASLARASHFGLVSDYAATADEQICLILQVESIKGLKALPDILTVDHVDAVFIGPADLAADMGHLGNTQHPDVVAAIEGALGQIVASDKAAGILTTDLQEARRFAELGATFLGVGVDVMLFAAAARDLAKQAETFKD